MITSGQMKPPESPALQSMGATLWMPWFLSHLATAYAELAQLERLALAKR